MRTEKKQTFINLLAKTISYGTTIAISFFLTPYLVSKIGKEAYSFYPMANNFVNYMGIITIALNSMASRFITVSLTKGNKEKANTYFISILVSNIIMSAILLIPMTLIVMYLNYFLDIPIDMVVQVKLLFAFVFISMIVNLITNVFGVAAFSQNRLDLSSLCDVIVGIVRVFLYLILFLCFQPNLVFVGVVAASVSVLTVFIQILFTKKLLPFIKYERKYFDLSSVKEIISSGSWNSINQIGAVLLSSVGLMFCNMFYGSSEAGDYSIALTIPQFINGITSMISSVFLPGLTIKYAQGKKTELIKHINTAQNIMGLLINIPIAVFMAVGVSFFKLWTPSVDPTKLHILSVFSISYLLVTSIAWPVSNMNTVMNKVKIPAIVMLLTGVINILLIFIFYRFTSIGVYSIPSCQMILFILNRGIFVNIYSAKNIKEKWYIFFPALIKSLIGAAIIYLISILINSFINPTTWIQLILECVILGVLGVIINSCIIYGVKRPIKLIGKLTRKKIKKF